MSLDVTPVLLAAQHLDAAIRSAAEEQLKQGQEQNFAGFLQALSTELANNAKPADSRRLAGLVLKNALTCKDDARRAAMHTRWTALDPSL